MNRGSPQRRPTSPASSPAEASHEVVALAAQSRHDVVRVAAAAAAPALPAEQGVSVTSQLLDDADAGVRIRAMKSAATIDSPALAARLKTMSEHDNDPDVRGLAASTYQRMRR